MTALREPNNLGDLLKYEAPNLYSREAAIVSAGQNLALGTVVGRDSTTGKLGALTPAATNGLEVAVGVLANPVEAALIDRADAILITRHAILARHAVIWPAAITPTQQATALLQLEARGVLVRTSA